MSALDEGPRVDTASTAESPEPTPTDRREAIETTLADGQADSPGLGELATRAEALADAHALAVDHPEQVDRLVPNIASTVLAVSTGSWSKGRQFLVGAYDTEVRQEGMAALAALDEAQLASSADRTAVVLQAVTGVLKTTATRIAHVEAIRTLGTVVVARPEFTADWLLTEHTDDRLPRFTGQFETALSGPADADALTDLLRTTAVLAGHEDLSRLVTGLSRSVLEDCADVDDSRVRIWTHVVSRQFDLASPVDTDLLWNRVERGRNPSSFYRWLLWAHTTGDIPMLDGDDPFTVLVESGAARYLNEVVRLPGISVDSRLGGDTTVTDALGTVLSGEASRTGAGYGLASLAGDESVAPARRSAAVEVLLDALETGGAGSDRVLQRLADLVEDGSLPPGCGTAVVETLETVLADGDESRHGTAAELLARLAADDERSTETRNALLDVFATRIEDERSSVRRQAATGLVALLARASIAPEHRVVAVDTVCAALAHDDAAVRTATVEALVTLPEGATLSADHRSTLLDALTTALVDDAVRVRIGAARVLVRFPNDEAPTAARDTAPADVLTSALDHHEPEVRRDAVQGIVERLERDGPTLDPSPTLVDALVTPIDDDDPDVRGAAARGLVVLARQDDVPTDLRATAATALAESLREANPDRILLTRTAKLAGEQTLPPDQRLVLVDALDDALTVDDREVQARATGELAALAGAESRYAIARGDETDSSGIRTHLVGILRDALGHERREVPRTAVRGLVALATNGHLSDDVRTALVAALEAGLDHDEEIIRGYAAVGVAALADDAPVDLWTDGLDTLGSVLDHANPRMRVRAASALRDVASDRTVPAGLRAQLVDPLTTALEHSYFQMNHDGAKGLAALAADATLPASLRADAYSELANSCEFDRQNLLDDHSRKWAATGLSLVADDDFRLDLSVDRYVTLDEALGGDHTGDRRYRTGVSTALHRRALVDLSVALDDHHRDVRSQAAFELCTVSGFGVLSPETAAGLVAVLGDALDDRPAVREPAAVAIRRICEQMPAVARYLDDPVLENIGTALSPTSPATTRPLLSALQAIIGDEPTALAPVEDAVSALLETDSPASVQAQTLELLSRQRVPRTVSEL